MMLWMSFCPLTTILQDAREQDAVTGRLTSGSRAALRWGPERWPWWSYSYVWVVLSRGLPTQDMPTPASD